MNFYYKPIDVFEKFFVEDRFIEFPLDLLPPDSDCENNSLIYQAGGTQTVVGGDYISIVLQSIDFNHSPEKMCELLIEELIKKVPKNVTKRNNPYSSFNVLLYKNLKFNIPTSSCVFVTNLKATLSSAAILCFDKITIFEMENNE